MKRIFNYFSSFVFSFTNNMGAKCSFKSRKLQW